jgi:hypothetical protein
MHIFFDNFSDQNCSDYVYNNEHKTIDPNYSGKRSLQIKDLVGSVIHDWWTVEDIGLDYGGRVDILSVAINSGGVKCEIFDPFDKDTLID